MTDETYEKLSDYYKSFIRTWENELYLIDRGVRSVCTDFLHYDKNDRDAVELIYELEQMTVRRNLYFATFDAVDKEDGKTNLVVYAYKYMHQLPLIKYVENGEKGYIREWILGKLLGYSDESMDEYLCRGLVDCFEIHDTYEKKDKPVKEEEPNDILNTAPVQEKIKYRVEKNIMATANKTEAQKDNAVLATKPEPDVFMFNDVEKKLDKFKKIAAESGIPVVRAAQDYAISTERFRCDT